MAGIYGTTILVERYIPEALDPIGEDGLPFCGCTGGYDQDLTNGVITDRANSRYPWVVEDYNKNNGLQ